MRALTVQQPWAWAIINGSKDVENRTQAWSYRGPLAIHAGARMSERGLTSELVHASLRAAGSDHPTLHRGAIIGVVDLVDAHVAVDECCESDWAELSYDEHGGQIRRDVVHLVLAHPRPLPEPIPCKGRLGLWTPEADMLEQPRVAR